MRLVPAGTGSSPVIPFAIASFLAVAAGCVTAASSGVAPAIWGRNAAAWLLGAVLLPVLARLCPARLLPVALVLAPCALLLSLAVPGQYGVHRWLSFGPLQANAAFLTLPAAVVACAAIVRRHPLQAACAAVAIECALCLQPDASQAAAFACAAIATILTRKIPAPIRAAAGLFFVLAAVFASTRPDPLLPVPEVEGIIGLAWALSFPLSVLAVASLAAASAAPLASRELRPPALALAAYFLACAVMPVFGAYPVPLVGMGISPILGFWAGIATLATRSVESSQSGMIP